MALNWKIYPVRDLGGGVNQAVSPFLVGPNEMKSVINYDLNQIGALEKVTGYAQHGDDIQSDTVGLSPLYYGSGQQVQIAAADTGAAVDTYKYDSSDGSWDAQSLTLGTGFKCEFAQFLDGLFMVNFNDDTYFYNGSTWSTSTNTTNAPKARYVLRYLDRLYLAYVDISGTTHNSRVVMSELPDDSYNISWDTSDDGLYFDVAPKNGDFITGLGNNFSRLLVFKEETLWRYDTNSLFQFPGAPGTNNNRTIVNVLDSTVYFHSSGVFGVQGNQVINYSRKVQHIIDGVSSTNLDKLCAYGKGDYYYIYLGDINNSIENIIINKCLGILDVARMRWTFESIAHEPTIFAPYRDDRSDVTYDDSAIAYNQDDKSYDSTITASDFIFFGADDGNIYQINAGNKTFDGTTIKASFETHNYYFAGIHARGQLQACKVYVKDGRRLKLFYSIDDGSWRPIERYEQGNHEIYFQFDSNAIGNRIKFKGTDSSTGEKSRVRGFDIFFTKQANIV